MKQPTLFHTSAQPADQTVALIWFARMRQVVAAAPDRKPITHFVRVRHSRLALRHFPTSQAND
jgi:hypothetical protein